MNICSTLYVPHNNPFLSALLNDNKIDVEKLDGCIEKYRNLKNAFYFLYESFKQVLNEKDKISIVCDKINLENEIYYKKVILANVVAEDYYKMDGDRTNHIVTLIPEIKHYIVIDPYEKMGYREFENWDEYLMLSQKYAWSQFNGFAVSF